MPKIVVKFQMGNNQQAVVKIEQTNSPPITCQMVKEDEKDRRIVRVLRKYLDLQLTDDQLQVFNKADFVVLGELLYELVFNDQNAKAALDYFYHQSLRGEADESFDIFLEFGKATAFEDLAILPWEYIYFRPQDKILQAEVKDPFLAADATKKINFYRKYPFTNLIDRAQLQFDISPQRPLRILLIIANPTQTQPLGLKMNVLYLFQEMVRKYGDLVDIRYLPQPNYDNEIFARELREGRPYNFKASDEEFDNPTFKLIAHDQKALGNFDPDIIHFVGHGKVEGDIGLISLIQEGENQSHSEGYMSDERFASCIENAGLRPKLVFLQISNGGRVVNLQQDGGLAPKLLKIKVPYVVTMQNPIQEDKAYNFTQTFYSEFLEGNDIGSAVSAGRFQLGQYSDANSIQNYAHKSFGSPVLFTTVDFPLKIRMSSGESTAASKPSQLVCPNPICINHLDHKRFPATTKNCPRCQTALVPQSDGYDHGKAGARRKPDSVSSGVSSTKRETANVAGANGASFQSSVNGNDSGSQNSWGLRLQAIKDHFFFLIETDIEMFFEEIKTYLVVGEKFDLTNSLEEAYRNLKARSQRGSAFVDQSGMTIQELKTSIKVLINQLVIDDIKASKFAG